MKLSTKTLQNLKDEIPRQLTGPYSEEDFPVEKFNEISAHLEKYCDTNYLTAEIIIPMEDQITDYPLDDKVRQVRGLYTIPTGGVLDANGQVVTASSVSSVPASTHPDKDNPIRFDVFGNILRIGFVPSTSEPIFEDSRTINDATGSTLLKLYDVGGGSPLDTDENLRGKAIIITYNSGVVDYLIIATNDGDDEYIRVNGQMSEIPDTNTVYSIYNDFFVLEYTVYLPTISLLTDTIDVPVDFESVYKWGLYWKYYAQEGENKVEIDRYQKLFEQEAMRFASDQNRYRSDNFITIPRSIPRMFPR